MTYRDLIEDIQNLDGCERTKQRVLDLLRTYEGARIRVTRHQNIRSKFATMMKSGRYFSVSEMAQRLEVAPMTIYRLHKEYRRGGASSS
jgi:hypothetical protein